MLSLGIGWCRSISVKSFIFQVFFKLDMLWKSYFSMYLIHYHEGQITNLMFKNFTGSCWRANKWVPSISRNVCWWTSTGSSDLSSSSLGCFLQKVIRKIPSKDKSKLFSYEKNILNWWTWVRTLNIAVNILMIEKHLEKSWWMSSTYGGQQFWTTPCIDSSK